MPDFFLYDYRFERVWKHPDNDIEKLSRYRAVLSPDFSMYLEMAPVMQLYNVFRSRWCGAYWASKGMRVIPTVNWGNEESFDFCFEGIERGSTVAVSTYMASEHDNRKDQKDWFMAGYNELLRRIAPEKIICYNTPFPEMQGDVVHVDYELSSWKFMNHEKSYLAEDNSAYQIGGTPAKKYDTMGQYLIGKGGGSVFGGEWRPSKPRDERLIGSPGVINRTTDSHENLVETKIGSDGRAIKERHHSDHNNPNLHSIPHDHLITWDENHPSFGSQQNYWDGIIPEFKRYLGGLYMSNIVYKQGHNAEDENNFKTISDFKWCMKCGGEVEFEWKGTRFGIVRYGTDNKITIYEANKPETGKVCEDSDDALEYIVSGDRLRDVITQVTVLDRTI